MASNAVTTLVRGLIAFAAVACAPTEEIAPRSPSAFPDVDEDGQPYGPFVDVAISGRLECGLRASGDLQCWRISGRQPEGRWAEIDALGANLCMLGFPDRDGVARVECYTSEGWISEWTVAGNPRAIRAAAGFTDWCALTDLGVQCDGVVELPRTDLVGIAAGVERVCGWDASGAVVCAGSRAPSLPPHLRVMDLLVSSGACAIRTDGVAQCFDTALGTPPLERFDRIWSSERHRCGRTEEGRVRCWNATTDHHPLQGSWLEVSVRSDIGCGLREDGEIGCWHMPP